MWSPLVEPDEPTAGRLDLWLRLVELLLTAVLLGVTLWRVLGPPG